MIYETLTGVPYSCNSTTARLDWRLGHLLKKVGKECCLIQDSFVGPCPKAFWHLKTYVLLAECETPILGSIFLYAVVHSPVYLFIHQNPPSQPDMRTEESTTTENRRGRPRRRPRRVCRCGGATRSPTGVRTESERGLGSEGVLGLAKYRGEFGDSIGFEFGML